MVGTTMSHYKVLEMIGQGAVLFFQGGSETSSKGAL